MATLKYSRQRESIKEFLRTRTDHPTADVVYENMKLIYPNISLGTVYRNLSLLADLGEIKKLSSFAGADHFDGRTERLPISSLSVNRQQEVCFGVSISSIASKEVYAHTLSSCP